MFLRNRSGEGRGVALMPRGRVVGGRMERLFAVGRGVRGLGLELVVEHVHRVPDRGNFEAVVVLGNLRIGCQQERRDKGWGWGLERGAGGKG